MVRTTEAWEFWYGLLQRFAAREGHAQVQGVFREDGYRLGGWVGDQRKRYNQGLLPDERIRRLEEVNGWTWDALEDSWEASFARLQSYSKRTGDSGVPSQYDDADGYRLGQWVSTQRRVYGRGELAEERDARLARLPNWRWHTHREAWERGYARLMRFVAEHGHAIVPKGFADADGRLDLWVLHQRVAYRRGSDKLSAEQIGRLAETPGWTWDPIEAAFAKGIERLNRYAHQRGNPFVPNDYTDEDGYKLGLWVANRRKDYKDGRLVPERVQALEAIDGWTWSQKGDAWEKGYERLQRFVTEHGHARVHRNYRDEEGYLLGSWVANQRHRYKSNRLTQDRVERLRQIDGWTGTSWESRSAENWELGYKWLRQFVEREDYAAVPRAWIEDGFKLGQWVSMQRTRFKRGKLDPVLTERLERLPGWTWDAREKATTGRRPSPSYG